MLRFLSQNSLELSENPLIFLGLGVIILAERFWSIAFLRKKMCKIKLRNARQGRGRKEETL